MSDRARVPGEAMMAAGGMAFELSKKWWVLALRGVVLIILGLLAFVNPLVWITFVGVYMLVDGAAMLFAGFGNQPDGQSRWPLIIIGILGIIAGIIVLVNPVLGGITLTIVIAAWAIVTGILEIISAIRLREEIDNEWWLIITGVLAIIFGILVFQNVLAGILTIAWVFGIFAIVAGILSIALAFRVRDFGTKIGAVR
ncbi:MAG: HdeD family acid-resistance protein [Thermomicrobiales bacterium]